MVWVQVRVRALSLCILCYVLLWPLKVRANMLRPVNESWLGRPMRQVVVNLGRLVRSEREGDMGVMESSVWQAMGPQPVSSRGRWLGMVAVVSLLGCSKREDAPPTDARDASMTVDVDFSRPTDGDGAAPVTDSGANCHSPSPRDTLVEPPTLVSKEGELDVVLTASTFTGSIALTNCTVNGLPKEAECVFDASAGGVQYTGKANGIEVGGIPGPTLVVEQGDSLEILLENEMPVQPQGHVAEWMLGCPPPSDSCATQCSDDPCPAPHEHFDPSMTNLHTHGLHVDPGTYAQVLAGAEVTPDNVYVSVLPGEQHQYDYGKLAEDHPTGLYWYHPHDHMTTDAQVGGGLAGAIVVKGSIDALLEKDLPCLQDRTMVFQALNPVPPAGVDAASVILDPVWVLNGQDMPTLTIRPGEVQRWRVLNAASETGLYLALAETLGTCASQQENSQYGQADQFEIDCDLGGTAAPPSTMNVIGVDGVPLSRPVQQGLPSITLLENMAFIDTPPKGKKTSQEGCPGNELEYQPGYFIPSGKRIEFLVQFDPDTPPGSTYKLVTRGFATNPFQVAYGREIANVIVEGAPSSDTIPDELLPPEAFGLRDLRTEAADGEHCLSFDVENKAPEPGVNVPVDFLLNEQNFCPARPILESVNGEQRGLCAALGDVDEWKIVNTTNDSHPFHIHVNPVQLTHVNGVAVSPAECSPAVFEDTVSLPMLTVNAGAEPRQDADGGMVKEAGAAADAGHGSSTSTSAESSGSDAGLGSCDAAALSAAGFVFKTKYTDFTGDPVFHCHILLHEDQSMMGRFTITGN